jgi:hypothetical protein
MILTALPARAEPAISVKDTKGRALDIELISLNSKTVRFRRAGNTQEFSLALDQFDAASQARITKTAASLPPVLPPIDVDVVVGKRRQKDGSSYMVEQVINATVKLRNSSHDTPLPKLTGRTFFFGQDQRNPDDFTVLSVQDFPVELKPGQSASSELESFATRYDSDNKGQGNVGGYQYSGYLLVFLNAKKEVVFNQTTDGSLRKEIDAHPKLLAAIAGYTKGAKLNKKMVPPFKLP